MNEHRLNIFLLFLALVCAAAMLTVVPFTGCDGDTTPSDATSDSTDVPGEETTLPPECLEDHDPLNPVLKMNFFDIQSPENLDNQVLENLMLEGFENGDFIWLLDCTGVDDGSSDTDGDFHLNTGFGEVIGDFPSSNCFRFINDPQWPATEADIAITGNDFSWKAAEPYITITVPVFKTNPETHVKELLLELPLKEVQVVSGTFSSDRTTIATSTSCTGSGGVLQGMITVNDAKEVMIEDMGVSLCGQLSGDKGSNLNDPSDDCQRPIAEWPVPPDTEFPGTGDPAYLMSACFSAIAVRVAEN